MKATTHPVAPEEIMAFLDGELSSDRAQSLSRHLNDCTTCKEAVELHRATSAALAAWTVPEEQVDSLFKSYLLKAASSTTYGPRVASLFRFRSYLRRHWLLTAVSSPLVAYLVLVVSTAIFRSTSDIVREKQLIEHQPTMHIDKAREVGGKPIAEQQSKVFSNQIPNEGQASNITSLATPGAVADSNGLFHGLGDHAQNSFSIDGQPLSDQQSRVFSGPMIARTVSLSIVVKDFDGSRKSLDTILARHNGYGASLNVSTPEGGARSLQASLRVPVSQVAAALGEIKTLGYVENQMQSGEEVTRQHADLVARLKIDRETERRFLAILKERNGDINQVLATEQAIARVRGEIEQMEAEQKNLEHRVDFASIDLKLAEEYKAQLNTPAPSVLMQLRNASINGFRSAFESFLALVLFVAESGPSLLLWLSLLGIPAWRLWRRYRRSQSLGSLAGA